MKVHTPIATICVAAISLFLIGCTQTRISSFVAEVSEAPEVHGFTPIKNRIPPPFASVAC